MECAHINHKQKIMWRYPVVFEVNFLCNFLCNLKISRLLILLRPKHIFWILMTRKLCLLIPEQATHESLKSDLSNDSRLCVRVVDTPYSVLLTLLPDAVQFRFKSSYQFLYIKASHIYLRNQAYRNDISVWEKIMGKPRKIFYINIRSFHRF